ncbi:UNVERIFIED_CONTAM: hypothetical protein HDU68_009738 [Siphonaria sp. JEL0065]|nr:hypothetical protein HDU68_009738 [Siphonaria sp. JEL0065]
MFFQIPTTVATLALCFLHHVYAFALKRQGSGNGCALFDKNGNLALFSTTGIRFLGSTPTSWSTQVSYSSNGLPAPSSNLICLSCFYLNSALFINADVNSPSTIYKFNFDSQQWSTITTSGISPNSNSMGAAIDFDTLVIYAFSDGRMVRLGDAGDNNLKNNPSTLEWVDANVNSVAFLDAAVYQPTMAHGWINMYFFGVPGTMGGEVWGYRIHYNEWGLAPQPVGATFPCIHGKTATFTYKDLAEFEHDGAPSHIAYIPDDYSGLWVVDSYVNQTFALPAPPKEGTSGATMYAASQSILIQYTPESDMLRHIDLTDILIRKESGSLASWVQVGGRK